MGWSRRLKQFVTIMMFLLFSVESPPPHPPTPSSTHHPFPQTNQKSFHKSKISIFQQSVLYVATNQVFFTHEEEDDHDRKALFSDWCLSAPPRRRVRDIPYFPALDEPSLLLFFNKNPIFQQSAVPIKASLDSSAASQ